MATNLNDSFGMCNLGIYYFWMNKFEKMKKFLLMAINLNNKYAMYTLGYYYNEIKDYDNMIKYYLMCAKYNYGLDHNILTEYINNNLYKINIDIIEKKTIE